MRGLRTDETAQVIIAGHAFVQNLRRAHYELTIDIRPPVGSRPRSPNSPKRSDHGLLPKFTVSTDSTMQQAQI